jgi:hypothetical protein
VCKRSNTLHSSNRIVGENVQKSTVALRLKPRLKAKDQVVFLLRYFSAGLLKNLFFDVLFNLFDLFVYNLYLVQFQITQFLNIYRLVSSQIYGAN